MRLLTSTDDGFHRVLIRSSYTQIKVGVSPASRIAVQGTAGAWLNQSSCDVTHHFIGTTFASSSAKDSICLVLIQFGQLHVVLSDRNAYLAGTSAPARAPAGRARSLGHCFIRATFFFFFLVLLLTVNTAYCPTLVPLDIMSAEIQQTALVKTARGTLPNLSLREHTCPRRTTASSDAVYEIEVAKSTSLGLTLHSDPTQTDLLFLTFLILGVLSGCLVD